MVERDPFNPRQYENIKEPEHVYDEPFSPLTNEPHYMPMSGNNPAPRRIYDEVDVPPPIPPKGDAVRQFSHSGSFETPPTASVVDYRANMPPPPPVSSSPHPPGGGMGNFEGTPAQMLLQQKDKEIYLLRMNVDDKADDVRKLNRDSDLCHQQMKHLNTLLSAKKEKNLEYQEQISSLQSELALLREELLSSVGSSVRSEVQGPAQVNTPAELALLAQVEQFSRQIMDLRRQLEQARHHNEQLRAEMGGASRGDPSEVQRLRMQADTLQRQNLDMKSKVEMLEVQVSTYNEDFDIERSDRERAQAGLQTIKEERDSLKQAINLLATEYGVQLDPQGLPRPP